MQKFKPGHIVQDAYGRIFVIKAVHTNNTPPSYQLQSLKHDLFWSEYCHYVEEEFEIATGDGHGS